jgi:hypothetical protein
VRHAAKSVLREHAKETANKVTDDYFKKLVKACGEYLEDIKPNLSSTPTDSLIALSTAHRRAAKYLRNRKYIR